MTCLDITDRKRIIFNVATRFHIWLFYKETRAKKNKLDSKWRRFAEFLSKNVFCIIFQLDKSLNSIEEKKISFLIGKCYRCDSRINRFIRFYDLVREFGNPTPLRFCWAYTANVQNISKNKRKNKFSDWIMRFSASTTINQSSIDRLNHKMK